MSQDKRFGKLTLTRRDGQGVVLFRGEDPSNSYRLMLMDIQDGSAKVVISVPDNLKVSVRRNWLSLGIRGVGEFDEALLPHNGKRLAIFEETDAIIIDGTIELTAVVIVGNHARVRVSAPIDIEIWRDELAIQVLRDAQQ